MRGGAFRGGKTRAGSPKEAESMKTKAVLQELFELLESYAPPWYSEEHRDRTIAALKHVEKPALQLLQPSQKRQASSSPSEPEVAAGRYLQ